VKTALLILVSGVGAGVLLTLLLGAAVGFAAGVLAGEWAWTAAGWHADGEGAGDE
jgi:hypothetical protein